jgi:hypothetical protein
MQQQEQQQQKQQRLNDLVIAGVEAARDVWLRVVVWCLSTARMVCYGV